MIFINTRPTIRHKPLPQVASLCTVVDLPLLEIVPRALSAKELALVDEHKLAQYQVLLAVSATAVEMAAQTLSQATLAQLAHANAQGKLTAIAVAEPTQKALQKLGFDVLVPDIASNEGLLAMHAITALRQGDKMLIWRGVGGRRLLADNVTKRGMDVCAQAFYERICPSNLPQRYQYLLPALQKQETVVLISSAMAWDNWCTMLKNTQTNKRLDEFFYLALGERLYALVGRALKNQSKVYLIHSLTDTCLYHACYNIRGNDE